MCARGPCATLGASKFRMILLRSTWHSARALSLSHRASATVFGLLFSVARVRESLLSDQEGRSGRGPLTLLLSDTRPTGTEISDSTAVCTHSDTVPLLSNCNSHLPLPEIKPDTPIEVLLDLSRDHVGFPTYSRDTPPQQVQDMRKHVGST